MITATAAVIDALVRSEQEKVEEQAEAKAEKKEKVDEQAKEKAEKQQ